MTLWIAPWTSYWRNSAPRTKPPCAPYERDLEELERRYSMTSDAFVQRYRQGVMGDDADFVEWNALFRMYTKVQNRLSLLQG
jgi:hypothetical protein